MLKFSLILLIIIFAFRYLEAYPRLQTYLKVAKFELKNHNPVSARQIFEQIPTDLGDEAYREDYFLTFARFEIRNKEYDRARAIFKFGLEKIPKERAGGLYEEYLVFEKQWGAKEEIDGLIISKRRNKYKSIEYIYYLFKKNYLRKIQYKESPLPFVFSPFSSRNI